MILTEKREGILELDVLILMLVLARWFLCRLPKKALQYGDK